MSGQDKASRDTGLPWLSAMVAAQLGVDAGSIDPDERLHHYGLTSLTASGLVATLSDHLGRTLPPTLVWDYPTLRGLMAFISGTPDAVTHRSPVPLADDDGIAIVGMACRFPGAESPGAFWHMLCTGTDAIREVPADRWPIDALYDPDPHAPGRMATRWGGFLDSVDRFDAAFFGLSPREAAQADPQQRLGLELAWEALEDAGIRPKRLAGSRTGVFMGAMWSDYARLLQDRDAIAPHTATGQDISIISARIAYVLGLEGPALTINTACSSALVAVHQACRSLRNGESTVALAGGVHLLLAPESSIAMTKFGAMSPDGRCKAFDSRANGYVRGEGGGIVVLKPFSAARADGDRIYAVIRGSAVNNDGPSNGLTAPNPAAQRAMLLDALADARVDASVVDYVEAHGTGTALGDPIEANALAAVLCHTRTAERPLRIGSVKTNIGHLEAAAGAAGLIKLALALHHRWIPASLHFQAPNPAIDFTGSRMAVQARGDAWPSGSALPIGGVSSFGFGGTNCHVIAQAAPPSGPHAAVLADTRPVFVFAGNGGNWPGMAAGLANHPAFAASLRASDESLAALGYPASVRDLLTNADGRVNDVALGQPALCAFQLAVVAVLADAGVKPSAVVGHSVGEAAAAAAAGILTQTEALRLVVTRSRLQAEVAGRGRMALAAADTAAVRRHLPADVVIAGENGPRATLLAGAPDAIDAACDALKAAGIVSQPVLVPVAYHSPQMDALRPKLEQAMQGVQPAAGTVPMASTVHGRMVEGTSLHAAYWGRNLRDPVLFRQAIEALRDAGHRMFLEIAPHPLLGAQVRQMVPDGIVVSPLRRGASDLPALQAALSPLAGERRGVRPRHLLLLSARTQAALDVLARRWADRLPADWADLCHTALVGRERFPWRLALHAADGEEARRRLREGDYLCGEAPRAGLPDFDQRRAPDESWSAWLDRCAQGFIAGADLDGAAFDAGEPWQVIAAPTYPFERERHWLPLPADGLSYELAWEPFRLPSMAGWPDIFPAGDQADPGLDALATRYARDALAMVPDGAIIPRHRALVRRLASWTALPGWSALAGPEPRQSAALELLTRVGQSLPGILTGHTDPLEALFPGGALDAAAGVYNAPPFAAAQQALAQIIGLIGAARPLRILELGAGTGALTGRLVAALPPASVLISTDVSAAFLSGLRRRFADAPQVRTAVFDIDHPVGCDGPFDAIVAANVVHAGANLAAILSALRDRLAPGGVLAFVELTRAPRWIDLVFGVTEGWWRFAGDPLRPRGALLDADGWRVALTAAGFTDVDIRADGDAHAVVLCRAAPVPRRWRLRGGGAARLRIAGSEPATGILFAAGDGNPAETVAELTAATEAGLPVSVLADTSLAGAACAGAALALALSDGDRIAGTIEVLDDDPASQAAALAAVERGVAEDQLRAADGSLFAGRVVRVQPASPPVPLSPDKLYVLAGGQGRLGFRFAQFLVQRGARHVLLVGRSPAAPGRLAQLNRNGVTARYLALDLSKSGAGEVLAAAFDRGLGGIIHAAGLADGPVDQVIAAKLAVADTLADAARNHVPGFLLLFSSAAGVWGTRGHVAYAAANRALDRWAERARAQGLPATAVAFGRFEEQGLLPNGEVAALEAAGLQAMDPDTAFIAALQAVADGVPHRIVAAVNWPRFAELFSARRQRTLFTRIAPPEAPKPQQAPVLGAAVPVARIAQPATLDLDGLRTLVADVLGHDDPARIDPDRGLFEQGLDSLLAVTLRQRLETASGTPKRWTHMSTS